MWWYFGQKPGPSRGRQRMGTRQELRAILHCTSVGGRERIRRKAETQSYLIERLEVEPGNVEKHEGKEK